jgi:hypothetical protein
VTTDGESVVDNSNSTINVTEDLEPAGFARRCWA